MILSDIDIKRRIHFTPKDLVIEPYDVHSVQNNSYLLSVKGDHLVDYLQHKNVWTKEYIKMPNNLVGLLTARSRLSRQGLFFATSIGVDAGFEGNLVIEFFNMNRVPFRLRDGDRIVHLLFAKTSSRCTPYNGEYNKQRSNGGLLDG